MFCPACSKDTSLSEGHAQVDRVRIVGTRLFASIQVLDLCAECFRLQREVRFDIERGLESEPGLKAHTAHNWRAEALGSERLASIPDGVTIKLLYGVTCECGELPMYEGNLTRSATFSIPPA